MLPEGLLMSDETPTLSEPHEIRRPTRLYLDTETTGLDPNCHEIIEIAILIEEVPENPNDLGKIIQTWERKIRPIHIRAAHPKALEVNGYTPEAWEGSLPFADHADEIAGLLASASTLVGHNPTFDTNFLRSAFAREGLGIRIPYHQIDTVSLAYAAWNWTGTGPGLSLDKIRDHLGISKDGTHSALKDALDCRAVLYRARQAIQSQARF